jgi:hypothetical protein
LTCVSEVPITLLKTNATNILKSTPLSNNTVSRHIDEMSKDRKPTVCRSVQLQIWDIIGWNNGANGLRMIY